MRSEIVAVIPAYQCAETIARIVAGCLVHLDRVVVVDDGSTDGTGERARLAGALVVRLESNCGKGVALARGVREALALGPPALLLLDGDGQHDPRDIPQFVAAWQVGAGELIIGSRMGRSDLIPRARYLINYIGSRVLSWMTGVELEDSQCGYRLLSAGLAAKLGLRAPGYAIESEMIIKTARLGAKIAHVPIATIYEGGESHFQPVRDTVRISWASVYFKIFDEP